MSEQRAFCSKVLLFGEYGIIKNSMGLAINYPLFSGKLSFRETKGPMDNGPKKVDQELKAFAQYLKNLKRAKKFSIGLDVDAFGFDVENGLFFKSTIPQGHGVGSSGALCAAILDRYGNREQRATEDEKSLRKMFALMESHFHGASSGIDPLISYLDCSILIKDKDRIERAEVPYDNYPNSGNDPKADRKSKGMIFLLNTCRSRRTEPLVNLFLEKCENPSFNGLCEQQLLPIIDKCIDYFLNREIARLYDNFARLSRFQLEHFLPMIPSLYRNLWRRGLDSKKYYLKLCGAGGGGLLLGITTDMELSAKQLEKHEIRPLFYF